MEPSLIAFSSEFRERLLSLLWRQWGALGVSGHAASWSRTPLDPEALLLLSCTVARWDPRLFDAMLDWLQVNGRYVNVHRLRRMVASSRFAGSAVLGAVAATVGSTNQPLKWKLASKRKPGQATPAAERFFRLPDGSPLPVLREPDANFLSHGFERDRYQPRATATRFRPDVPANLLLRLRAFIGISARCEILAYLLLNSQGSPSAVARACAYYTATVTKALAEMGDSGYVMSRVEGRRRHYAVYPDMWRRLLLPSDTIPAWISWMELYAAVEQLWLFLADPDLAAQSRLAQSSALRRVLRNGASERLAQSRAPVTFAGADQHAGESLIPFFVERTRELFDALNALG